MLVDIPRFMTIKETARTGIMSETHLRRLQKLGELPGIYAGSRFMVNVNLLVEYLNEVSKKGGQHVEN